MLIKSLELTFNFKKSHKKYVCILSMCLLGCTLSTTRTNLETDVALSKKVAKDFYTELTKQKYSQTWDLFSSKFRTEIDTATLFNLYRNNEVKFGAIKGISKINVETKSVISDSKISKVFLILCEINRTIHPTKERIVLRSLEGDEPKIYTYQILDEHK